MYFIFILYICNQQQDTTSTSKYYHVDSCVVEELKEFYSKPPRNKTWEWEIILDTTTPVN